MRTMNIGVFESYVSGIDVGNKFIKSLPNWTGVIPEKGDYIVLHSGDDNEEEYIYEVHAKVVNFIDPGYIRLIVNKIRPVGPERHEAFNDWPDGDSGKRI